MSRSRAVSPAQKDARRARILAAAASLFDQADYPAVSMEQVARAAGVAKGTVFLYFETKETLFLNLVRDAFKAWFARLDSALESAPAPLTTLAFTRLVEASLRDQPALLRLIPILHPVIEHNVSLESIHAFKRMLLGHLLASGARIETRLEYLQPGQGAQLLNRLYALLVGLQNAANPAPLARQVIEQPGFELLRVNPLAEFTAMLNLYLYGLETLYRRTRR
ncbi:MAG: TetR family transcriptional regulator [Bellilinea sp.]|jgi:AcrR family transcriptional regulator